MNVTLDKICLVADNLQCLDWFAYAVQSIWYQQGNTYVVIRAVIWFNFEWDNKKRVDLLILLNALGF